MRDSTIPIRVGHCSVGSPGCIERLLSLNSSQIQVAPGKEFRCRTSNLVPLPKSVTTIWQCEPYVSHSLEWFSTQGIANVPLTNTELNQTLNLNDQASVPLHKFCFSNLSHANIPHIERNPQSI